LNGNGLSWTPKGKHWVAWRRRLRRFCAASISPGSLPNVDCGDYVVVVNAEKIHVTGRRMDQKMYYRHSGYPGGLKQINLRHQLERFPTRPVEIAVRGMLPKTKLGRKMFKKLKVYAGPEHPHQAQQPEPLEL
jgi:large subunit ribosomal protein L13